MEIKEVSLNEIISEIKKIRQEYQNSNDEEKIKQLQNFNRQIEKGLEKIKDEETKKIIEEILNFVNIQHGNLIKKYIGAKNDTIDICSIFIDNFENVKSVINDTLYKNFKVKLDFENPKK